MEKVNRSTIKGLGYSHMYPVVRVGQPPYLAFQAVFPLHSSSQPSASIIAVCVPGLNTHRSQRWTWILPVVFQCLLSWAHICANIHTSQLLVVCIPLRALLRAIKRASLVWYIWAVFDQLSSGLSRTKAASHLLFIIQQVHVGTGKGLRQLSFYIQNLMSSVVSGG